MLPVQVLALRDLLNTYLEPQHVATVLRAYETGALAHEGQKRRSGEDYITHPVEVARILARLRMEDRKSTRLNSSHVAISYAVFCLKKKTPARSTPTQHRASR